MSYCVDRRNALSFESDASEWIVWLKLISLVISEQAPGVTGKPPLSHYYPHSPCWGTGEPALTLLGDRWSCFFSSCLNSSSSRSPERLTSAEAKACFSVSSVSMLICSSIWWHTWQSDQYTETYHGWAQGEQVALTCVPGIDRYAKIKKWTTLLDALLSCLFAYLLCPSKGYLQALEQPHQTIPKIPFSKE